MAGRKKLEGPGVNYFQLPRKQLQSLCKKYGFPANRTNQLMAEFLTAHLNSDEYLNRDESLPSPAVKTRFQCRDEESTTDDNLPTIPEMQPMASETQPRNLFHDDVNNDAQRTDDHAPGASNPEEETYHEPLQVTPLKEDLDVRNSDFRIRDSCLLLQTESRQSVPTTTTQDSMDCTTIEGSEGEACRIESVHLSNSEEATDATTAVDFGTRDFSVETQKAPGEETPLPLSTMPHVRPITPEVCAFSEEKGVKLFVDLETGSGLSPGENRRDDYRAWGAPLTSRTEQEKMQENVISGSAETFEGSENKWSVLECHLDTVLNQADRADKDQDGAKNLSLQASIGCRTADASALKSCLLTPNRKLSKTLNVSFDCPPVFSSPRSINGLAGRSEIVKEWHENQNQEKTFDQSNEVASCSDNDKTENVDLVLKPLGENSPALELTEGIERAPPTSAADLESPPDGIVERAVNLYEHKLSSRGPSSIQRKESYKSSPFLQSSRIAAELERASKLGHTRRVGVLALKRAIGVGPLFSDSTTDDVERESHQDGASSSPVSDSSPIDGAFAGNANTCNAFLLEPADSVVVQDEKVSDSGVSPLNMEMETTPRILSSSTESPRGVTGDATRDDDMMPSAEEGSVDKSEPTLLSKIDTTTVSNVDGSEAPLAGDKAMNLPAAVEESVSNLSWMTKPIQLPSRRPINHKLKEKPGRPFSTNGRTLELMERASAKLKMLKKTTAVRDDGVVSRPKKSTSGANVDEMKIRGVAQQVETGNELSTIKRNTEDPATRVEKGQDTSSQLDLKYSPESSCQKAEKSSCTLGVSNEALEKRKMSIATEEGENIQGRLSMQTNGVCEEDSSESEKAASENPAVALSFLDIDFTQVRVGKPIEVQQPAIASETESPQGTRERTTADKFTPLSPLDSNRLAIDTEVYSSPNMPSPTKLSGTLLDVVSQSEEKNNPNSLSFYGKENEWSRRQEQHKTTPFSGRSKEKALRTAEKASNLREQLLRKRRGMLEQEQIDGSDSPVQSIQLRTLDRLL